MYEASTRVYMLHLVGYNILADKSLVYIDAKYISLFTKLEHVNWERGCAALMVLYTTLGNVTVFETRQLTYYMCLFRV